MKLRNGFVSNSSSSSFVAVGFFLSKQDIDLAEDLYDTANDNGFFLYDGSDGGLKSGEIAVGREMYRASDDGSYMNEDRFSLTEFNKEAESVKEFLKEQGIEVTTEPTLFGGTRAS